MFFKLVRSYLEYLLIRFLVFKVKYIPFNVLYYCSDIFAFLLRHVIRYRRKTVRKNLKIAFPEKNNHELKLIEKGFYRYLADLILETFKGFSLSKDTFIKRVIIENPQILDDYYEKRKSCVFLIAHYGNWEWITHIIPFLKHHSCVLYKPIHNKFIDQYVLKRRNKSRMSLYSIEQTALMIRNNIRKPAIFAYIADQNPPHEPQEQFWVRFFNRPTAALSGAESLARKFDLPVFYLWVTPIKRGFYKFRLDILSHEPKQTYPGQITQLYMSKLEEQIKQNPAYWLWSHRRWKRKVPEHIEKKFVCNIN